MCTYNVKRPYFYIYILTSLTPPPLLALLVLRRSYNTPQWAALALFVGIPLPGTGAWTGALAAFVLGMPLMTSLTAIFAGVVSAGVIMSALTMAGRKVSPGVALHIPLSTPKQLLYGTPLRY